ncbi:hypothetical protein R3W88_014217 [Solanum pinnatisectum]|uniref:Uncharacterized protein n=1 Tax=Solanum pinnatisectum TaxID=50273 RepID=A0AAV9KTE1_9SOLN|nr:hypothetical protein R3W88_014217 [Solanum pinnatisectum]
MLLNQIGEALIDQHHQIQGEKHQSWQLAGKPQAPGGEDCVKRQKYQGQDIDIIEICFRKAGFTVSAY